jgi:5-dehydro-2-deoxygluconokinase
MTALDVLTVGRIGVDLYAEQPRTGFAAARSFAKSIGGSPTNVAVAAARLGRHAAVLTGVGDDEPGRYALQALRDFGVDTALVRSHPRLPTPLVLSAAAEPDEPWVAFYREPKAPDAELTIDDDLRSRATSASLLWVSGCALAADPTSATVLELLEARARRPLVVLDLDYRPSFWESEQRARDLVGRAIDRATVVVGNREECRVALGTSDPDAVCELLLGRGVELAVVKLGKDGSLLATADEVVRIAPVEVNVVSALGAGDAFGGALCHGLLAGWSLERAGTFAGAAGALVASRLLCAPAMPTELEVNDFLAGRYG